MVQFFDEFFDEGKSKLSFSMERVGEVFRYCVFCDTYTIKRADIIKKGNGFFWLRQTGFKMQVKKNKFSNPLKPKRGNIVIFFFGDMAER